MSDWEALLALQRLDTTHDQLQHRLANLPERAALADAQAQVAACQARLDELDARIAELARSQKRLEDEIALIEAKERDVERRLARGTVPREVQAMSDELDSLRSRRGGMEDEVLELMEQLESLQAEADAATEERARLDAAEVEAREALAAAAEAIEAELAGVSAERGPAAARVPASLLEEYERLRARLGGVAVAEVVNGRCTGCMLSLPASEVERLRHLAPDERATCEECGRLLVHG